MTVDELADLELCYAPPVGSAKSPLNFAGMIAQDMLEGLVETVQWKDLHQLAADGAHVVVDVRNPPELEADGILHPDAINVPLDHLRDRIGELPREKTLVTSCLSGQRGYYAARILAQHGYRVKNLDGALRTMLAAPPSSTTS